MGCTVTFNGWWPATAEAVKDALWKRSTSSLPWHPATYNSTDIPGIRWHIITFLQPKKWSLTKTYFFLILDFAASNERLQISLHVHHVRKYNTPPPCWWVTPSLSQGRQLPRNRNTIPEIKARRRSPKRVPRKVFHSIPSSPSQLIIITDQTSSLCSSTSTSSNNNLIIDSSHSPTDSHPQPLMIMLLLQRRLSWLVFFLFRGWFIGHREHRSGRL